ncbi:hypothetical protein ACH3XW_44740 [Acanthocheilonema viteae]
MSSSQPQHTALDRKDYLNCTTRTYTTNHNTQHQSTQAGSTLLGADSPTVHGSSRASLGSIIRGTKGHLSSILGSVTQVCHLHAFPLSTIHHLSSHASFKTFTSRSSNAVILSSVKQLSCMYAYKQPYFNRLILKTDHFTIQTYITTLIISHE